MSRAGKEKKKKKEGENELRIFFLSYMSYLKWHYLARRLQMKQPYLLGQKGNDLCTDSIQSLDNFCLQRKEKKYRSIY